MQHKDLRLDIKAVGEDGTFEGYLSVYGALDLAGDVVEPGAFTKTIKEHGGRVPMLWQHETKQPIGILELSDDEYGLKVKGSLVLSVQRAAEAYDLLKAGVIKGLSIGFDAIKAPLEKGIRRLKEVKLYEGSLVTFPALPLAMVTSVKAESKNDFTSELEAIQTYHMRGMMMQALHYALDSCLYDEEMEPENRIADSAMCIDQFKAQYMEHMPKLLTAWGEMKEFLAAEHKAGRRISAATRSQIEECISKLNTILEDDTQLEDDEKALPETTECTPEGAAPVEIAAAATTEPDALHSLVTSLQGWSDALRASSAHTTN